MPNEVIPKSTDWPQRHKIRLNIIYYLAGNAPLDQFKDKDTDDVASNTAEDQIT